MELPRLFALALLIGVRSVHAQDLLSCAEALYSEAKYICYDGKFLCPVLDGTVTLRCGNDCYLSDQYSCNDGKLGRPTDSPDTLPGNACAGSPSIQYLSDPPYANYLYSDCHSSSHLIVTSPLATSNLSIIGPRLLIAWPAGNSGIATFFQPQNGVNGSLTMSVENSTIGQKLQGVYLPPEEGSLSDEPYVGVSALIKFNSSAVLTTPILGSIRNIRDFTEGPSLLYPVIQDAIDFTELDDGGVMMSRLWLDNMTTTWISFTPTNGGGVVLNNKTLELEAGTYNFTAAFDYPQLIQLNASSVLNEQFQELVDSNLVQTTSLSFLSYSQKLLAGTWRFLTYFGRDSMIATLLLQPVLSEGEGGAIEAVIGAVLERLNRTSGVVCHEETIGDYATYLHLQDNETSTAPGCTYLMVDTDYFLPPLMESYFLKTRTGQQRKEAYLAIESTLDFGNQGLKYGEIAQINAEGIMNRTAAFASPGGQVKKNLIHLNDDEIVGQWRDSTYGIGGGRIPYDVNTALVPAALRSIAALSAAGYFKGHDDWEQLAAEYAKVWEDNTLKYFEVVVQQGEAQVMVEEYTTATGFGFPSRSDEITSDVVFHGLALDGNDNQTLVRVMNSDDCFRLFLTNTTDQAQLTAFINQTANNIMAPFPVGLNNPVGMLIANPAYGDDRVYAANFSTNAYHGTVVWSWQLSMMAAGLERQLARCSDTSPPDFCADESVHPNVVAAYNSLWDNIEANEVNINAEVWSWIYRDGNFVFEPLGALPPAPGVNPTESNIRQLWSLTWIAVRRDESLR